MSNYKVISSDSHIVEPADLWTARSEPVWKERMPRLVREEGDADVWYCESQKLMGVTLGAQAGVRFEDQEKMITKATFEDVRPGGYIPDEHIKDMDLDGVDGGVIYPSMGLFLWTVPDGVLLDNIFRIYNDWLAEFCKPYSYRMKGIAMVNVDAVGVAAKELERCANMGLVGAMITCYPPFGEPYSLPKYEPLWAAAQDLNIPLSLHAATNRPGPGQPITLGDSRDPRAAHQANRDHWVKECLADLIFDGIFERYPNLQVGSVEFELAWIPHFLERIDYTYTQRTLKPEWHRYKEDMLPSDYFHRNVFMSFQEDGLGIRDRHIIGVDNLMWGSDYPHPESTFPRSREILEEILSACTEEEKAKIAGANAARLFGFN